ncbi:MAG TPA: hypothetical protein DCZ94_21945 [Lentisphaeria bacterium]|nr:MAG: hypothetical protein A2X48_19215 [Lentisphaerae bacterium GWF2_49_21]HBC89609.1 hypothetical protein [Lentisphaeria bacterium]
MIFLLLFFYTGIGGYSADIFSYSCLEKKAVSSVDGKNTALESGKDSSTGTLQTIQVRKESDFPEVLKAGQRAAVFLDGLEAKNILIDCMAVLERLEGSLDIPTFEVLFNERSIYRKAFVGHTVEFTAFVPSSYVEKGSNVIQIRISEKAVFKCSFFKVSYLSDASNTPPVGEEAEKRLAKLSEDIKYLSSGGEKFQRKLIILAEYEMIKAVDDGARAESFRGLLSGNMFDPVSGEPLPVYFAAMKMMNCFKNASGTLPCNITPVNSDSFVSPFTDWTSVLCGDYTAVLAIASRDPIGKDVRILLPIPWGGETEIEIIRGIIPEKLKERYPDLPELKTEKEKTDIISGFYEKEVNFKENLILKLTKSGKTKIESLDFTYKKATSPVFMRGVAVVVGKRPNSTDVIVSLRNTDSLNSVHSSRTCSIKAVDATKGDIGGIKGIIPYDKKSDFVEISYPGGKTYAADGANLLLGGVPENYREFSFWVYPRIYPQLDTSLPAASKYAAKQTSPLRKITLLFYVESEKGCQFFAVELKADEWQRVILPSGKVRLPSSARICIVGDPRLPEYAKGNKVSFEFNGFCVTDDTYLKLGDKECKSGLASTRIIDKSKGLLFIFTGKPGSHMEYRHSFKDPMDLSAASEVAEYHGLNYVYKKDAQLLEISGKFPALSESIKQNENTKSYPVDDRLRKILTADELKKVELGELTAVAVEVVMKE